MYLMKKIMQCLSEFTCMLPIIFPVSFFGVLLEWKMHAAAIRSKLEHKARGYHGGKMIQMEEKANIP